jgi:hypothetical protein
MKFGKVERSYFGSNLVTRMQMFESVTSYTDFTRHSLFSN